MSSAADIKQKLTTALSPESLTITDDSALHAGHNPAAAGGGTHFTVKIVSDAFAGLTRVKRQQLVYGLLATEFDAGLHALSLVTQTPDEAR